MIKRERFAQTALVAACLMVSAAPGANAQSVMDRFRSLFGGSSQPATETPAAPDVDDSGLSCPMVSIRSGASTFAVGATAGEVIGNNVRYQATISRTARACGLNAGQITARIGIQGRVIAGPAGAPATVDIPLRVAVVEGGIREKVIATKVYRTSVAMSADGSAPFTIVAEDLTYPAPTAEAGDKYIFYIGFDPQAAKAEPRAKGKRK